MNYEKQWLQDGTYPQADFVAMIFFPFPSGTAMCPTVS
jgi:hypothetical protein